MSQHSIEYITTQTITPFSDLEKRLFNIFNETVREALTIDAIRNRYQETYQVDLFFLKQNGQDIGFAMITFYKTKHQNKTIFFARPAMGILNSARGAKFPMEKYIAAFMRFKLKHPFTPVMMFTCPVNPIPYAASSKYWIDSFPKHNKAYPPAIQAIKQTALNFFQTPEIRENVLRLPFGPLLNDNDIRRFYERKSSNPHVAYFLANNPNFLQNESLVLMIPVSFKNIAYICYNQIAKMVTNKPKTKTKKVPKTASAS